jgi:hypothetical protein
VDGMTNWRSSAIFQESRSPVKRLPPIDLQPRSADTGHPRPKNETFSQDAASAERSVCRTFNI